MTYDLDTAIRLATKDALTDLKRDGLDDLSNPHAGEIISEHARSAAPVEYGHLLDLYINHSDDLLRYIDDVDADTMYQQSPDPLVNYTGITEAASRLIEARMLGYLQDLIHADVD